MGINFKQKFKGRFRRTKPPIAPKVQRSLQIARSLLLFLCLSQIWGCTSNVRLLGTPVESNGLGLNSPYAETMPQVSKQFLTFVSDRNGSQDVYLWDITTRRLIPLPNLNRFDTIAASPSISEDGRYLAFSASQNDRVGIYIYDRSTQQVRRIGGNLRGETRHPHLSADGQRITFEVNQQGQWDVVVYSRSGQPLFGSVF
jgi:Tol biopolymer transport system component